MAIESSHDVREENKSRKTIWKVPAYVLGAIIATLAINKTIEYYVKNIGSSDSSIASYYIGKVISRLSDPNPFDYVKWKRVDYTQSNTGIWSFYMAEDVDHDMFLWHEYKRHVNTKNNFDSRGHTSDGTILLPDMDGDGLVGKEELKK